MPPDARNLNCLADALVDALAAATTFSVEFDALWSDDALAVLDGDTMDKVQVWVVDLAESSLPAWNSTASQHGCPIDELELSLVVQRRFGAADDRPTLVKALGHFCSELARFCRQTVLDQASCIRTERKPARDLKLYNETGVFWAEILTTWHRETETD